MKKNYTVIRGVFLLLCIVGFACGQKGKAHAHAEEAQYTCPMHPQIINNGPGQCPICGMHLVPLSTDSHGSVDSALLPLLKPVNRQVIDKLPIIEAEGGTRIFSLPVQGVVSYDARRQRSLASRVSGRIERLYIKYNYQPVRKGQLIMEIYSPDLVAAQRELIYVGRSAPDASLLQRARQRLLLLGMTAGQIDAVLKKGKPQYRVPVYSPVSGYIVDQALLAPAPSTTTPMATSAPAATGGDGMAGMSGSASSTPAATVQPSPTNNSPVLTREGQYVSAGQTVFNVYGDNGLVADFYFDPTLAQHIKRGQRLVYNTVAQPDNILTGTIGLIEPTQRNGALFSTARVYIGSSELQPGQLLSGRIPVVARGWWLPQSAVVNLGNNAVVFKKEGAVFVPKQVPVGIRVQGLVQVLDSVGGWSIAKNASYLVDGESFIRTAENN